MKPETLPPLDTLVLRTYEALSEGRIEEAQAGLTQGLAAYPFDDRLRVMAAALAQSAGDAASAVGHLWAALAARPDSELARGELQHLVLTPRTDPATTDKDFSLNSGERQVAEDLQHIRADHRARYAMAARWLRQQERPSWQMTGLDLFCGNGYGSRMLSQQAGARMVGIDGSSEAVALATRAYGSHRTVFTQAIFPFELTPGLFDFVVSFESIEHVDDAPGLLQQMALATEGPFIVSVPHEPCLPFARFGRRFEHHVRHYHREELLELLAQVGRRRIRAEYGQMVYRVEGGDMVGLLPEARMGLHPFDPQSSQFLILIAERG